VTGNYRAAARARDIALSGTALVLLSPVMAATYAVVRRRLGTPVFFRQQRPGLNGEPFTMVKFRTMLDIDESAGLLTDEQRLTSLGVTLRAASLDELPALWNVLRGDMSLVGPRPLLMAYLDRYTPRQARRHEVRPGLTGWAQVNGRNEVGWDERLEMDVWYVDHASFRLDAQILWRTVTAVLRRDGVTAEGHATMPEFLGAAQGGSAA